MALLPTINSWAESNKSLHIPDHSHQTYSTAGTQKVTKVLNTHTSSGVRVNGSTSVYKGKM